MKKRLTMLLAAFVLCIGGVLAQTKVNGTVVSQDDGQPVIGASVLVVGTQVGTVTNANGQFSLTVPEGKKTLRITYVGMEPIEVSARPNMRILLTSDQKALDEVIVVAFGTAKKSAFTGSAKVVGSEDLALSQVTSVTDALAGAVAGVQIVNDSGDPSSTGTIRIRGFGSLNASQSPLIIVDGAPYDGDMANINPSDIESMTVLKDAASNALYGARGANGVIMITTKRAKQGQPAKVTFDGKWGVNTRALQHYDVIKSPAQYYERQWASIYNQQIDNGLTPEQAYREATDIITTANDGGLGYNIWTVPNGQELFDMNGRLNPNASLGYMANVGGKDYWITPDDWEKEGTRDGVRQEYNVNISGASDKSTFYLSTGYLKNEGLMTNSDMQRFTSRLRADYQAKKWLKVGANMSYTRFDHNSMGNNGSETSTGNPWAFTTEMAPIYPMWVRGGDKNVMIDDNGIAMMDYGNGMNAGMSRLFVNDANPIQDQRLNTRNSEGNAFNASGFADITLYKGLTLTINGTMNLDETRHTYVYNPYYGQFDTTGGTIEKYHYRYYSYNLQQLLNYVTTIKNIHNIGVMLGHEYYDYRSYRLNAGKSKMFSQKNKELGGAAIDGKNAYSSQSRYNNEGYFGRAQYDYDGKYFGSASLRRDASSRFDPEYRWGTFWSLGGAWLINKEKFFNVDWVDELKVKASYGQQGNDNIGSYLYTDRYDVKNSAGNIGLEYSSKGTRDITWETQGNFNAGFEFSLLKGRITGGLEYYYRKTTDMLYSFSVAPTLGYPNYYDNVGDMYNTGVELDVTGSIIRTKDFSWDVNFNISSLKNRITKLHEDKKTSIVYGTDGKTWNGYTSGSYFITEGSSIYSWYLKEYAGVSENGKASWYYNVYEQAQSVDAQGNLLWNQAVDENGKPVWNQAVDENGNPVVDEEGNPVWNENSPVWDTNNPVMHDVYYDANGNVVDINTYKGKDARRKVVGREKTDTWSEADYYVLEKTTLPRFYGGFGTTVRFKGFDFSANFTYQLGGKQHDDTYAAFMTTPNDSHGGWNVHKDALNCWTPENTNTNVPRWQYGDTNVGNTQTRFLTDASYLNLQNLNLGYTLPKSLTMKFQVEQIRVYASAENVVYWSKRKGFDPRQSFSSAPNASRYSPMRTVSGGLTVTF